MARLTLADGTELKSDETVKDLVKGWGLALRSQVPWTFGRDEPISVNPFQVVMIRE